MEDNHVYRDKRVERDGIGASSRRNGPEAPAGRSQSDGAFGSDRLAAIVRRLDRLRRAPSALLARLVAERGACMALLPDGDPPNRLFDAGTDREIAQRLCAGCLVQDECLELELRLYGSDTVGVWGALGEDDRRATYPLWAQRSTADPNGDGRVERGDR